MRCVNDILDSRWLTNHGKYVKELESRVARLVGVRHCIAVCNATIGLELLVRALPMHGEVIVPSFTFVATAHALQWQGISPVFADIDPHTHCLAPASVAAAITSKTTGIVGVHIWGEPCATAELQQLAERHRLHLIFDAAHAFGCASRGQMIGTFGRAEVFSFHATKFINAFEGGAIVTDDDALAEKLRLMQNFGFSGYDNVIYIGTNGKMTEIAAAMGLANIDSMAEIIEHNRENYLEYQKQLKALPGLSIKTVSQSEKRNFQYIVTEVDESVLGLTRDELVQVLHAENVIARRYFYPGVHNMEPYRSRPGRSSFLEETEALCKRVLILPTGTAVSRTDIASVCGAIRVAATNAPLVKDRLKAMAG